MVLFTFMFPMFALTVLRIWRPGKTGKSFYDRVAWTIFAFGVYAMFYMAIYSMISEGEGGIRSWETRRLHKKLFFACALVAVAGPLIVFFRQVTGGDSKSRSHGKRGDGLDVE